MDARWRELGLENKNEYPVWRLHSERVFFDECPKCTNLEGEGCPVAKGRLGYKFLLSLHTVTFTLMSNFIFFF